jgi:uncharacterized protein YeeX (DUF496 family)
VIYFVLFLLPPSNKSITQKLNDNTKKDYCSRWDNYVISWKVVSKDNQKTAQGYI